MSHEPSERDFKRRLTRQVKIGNVHVGGNAPVCLQSMTSTHTHDVDSTIAQINRLAAAGCDVVRVAVPDRKDTEALKEIVRQSPMPVVADVHFHFQRALEAIAAGVHKIRLNPGNIKDRKQVNEVIRACRDAGIPIRVGVNEGSIVERQDQQLRAAERENLAADRSNLVGLMVRKMEDYIRIFEENDFHDVVLAAKSPDPIIVIDAYRAISRRFDYPLHLGVTHAGPPETGRIRSIAALASLLAEGIGDTIRISYAADPIHEVEDGKELLCSLGLRPRTEPELIACPTCGRIEVDLFKLVTQIRTKLASLKTPIKVAVMGCVVNGPGEAEGADVAVFAGRGRGVIYVQGEQVRSVNEDQIVEALYDEARAFASRVERGEARLSRGEVSITPA
ncbi:MAG TPA: flavodoxin-dependent (E)-4-hydroxy-3-methylbut-2-enyl-diphosphate synthase [Phycisphaerae bacterium]|nr:flavodoxin-dependent (E)-4-hydroxy-3-methylbut-2-enyl-diphosphate synthase [Phycisphaerae bacterium]HRY69606.1 flavodoxin-dependent (E)-4-hydroxy-3-methylbut-2-enyl-diphosphate synthase [Phycisphaerae bacterium]HSA27279.1 flavodoxin-dependent (E)-4-hydroxy-3-methylbut-2-enyl-diphosphate synthase [Phycisphaerae bacterium]